MLKSPLFSLLLAGALACLPVFAPGTLRAASASFYVAQSAPFKLVVRNGAMTQGGAIPTGWDGKFGDVELARDTATFKGKPASFRVSISGGKSGQGFQTIAGGASATFKIAGWIKCSGNVKAQALVQAFAEGYKQNQFLQIQYVQGETDWVHFEKEVTLPPWTAFFNVGMLVEGDGKAWLDEVHEASSPVDGGATVAPGDITAGPPDKDKPNAPGWGFYPQYPQAWQAMHNGFVARTKENATKPVNVVFLGDSITQGWGGEGKAIWAKRYEPLGAVNYGIGGDSTRQVLWRIQRGEVDGLAPKLVVLKIGTNNLYSDFNAGTNDEIADGITTIVTALRAKLPRTRILLLGILPRQNDYFSNRVAAINANIARLDDGNAVRFLDVGAKFLDAPGKVKPTLFTGDKLHLVAAGYQIWADAMQTLFDAMLNAPTLNEKSGVSATTGATPKGGRQGRKAAPKRNKGSRKVTASGAKAASSTKPAGTKNAPGATREAAYWRAMPMVSDELLAKGVTLGGEGCQYPQTIAIDSINGSFLLYGTDVGGIFRSTDGGKTFSPCNLGYSAIGSCGFAMDPKNLDRCLAIGDNAGGPYYAYDGIYLSIDKGASWRQVLPKLNRGNEKAREQVAYDPASFDADKGFCLIAYWAEEGNGEEPGGRLYKTTDGGENWTQIADGKAYGGGNATSLLKVAPQNGIVYIANDSGFYRSTDGGATFRRTLTGNLTSLEVIARQSDVVLTSTESMLMRSTDAGRTFAPVASRGITGFYRVRVSPADPQRLLCQNPKDGERYFSTDGGATWIKSGKNFAKSWIPPEILYNDRARLVAWHPTNPDVAFGIGPGDIITKTENGGRVFQWANNGNNGIMTGGLFNFNAQNPDVLYCGSQDYNGALTTNGGKSWQLINLSKDNRHAKRGDDGDPWGWVYGGYAASDKILYGGNRAFQEETYNLWITFDGGKTTQQRATGLAGAQVSCGDPTDPNVLFCWNMRSGDKGQTWAKMTGCDGVFTTVKTSVNRSVLYGRNGKTVVRSTDKGVTWQTLATLPAEIRDLACDPKRNRLYIPTSENKLYQCDGPDYKPIDISDRLPRDQHGDSMMVSTIAVDPMEPNVVYAGANGTGLFFQRSNGVARSTDGGVTWERLTANPVYCRNGVTGGQMASAIRVHPLTRFLFVGTDCYGMWKFPPPASTGKTIATRNGGQP